MSGKYRTAFNLMGAMALMQNISDLRIPAGKDPICQSDSQGRIDVFIRIKDNLNPIF